MQASLRNNFAQYYDYASLDCSPTARLHSSSQQQAIATVRLTHQGAGPALVHHQDPHHHHHQDEYLHQLQAHPQLGIQSSVDNEYHLVNCYSHNNSSEHDDNNNKQQPICDRLILYNNPDQSQNLENHHQLATISEGHVQQHDTAGDGVASQYHQATIYYEPAEICDTRQQPTNSVLNQEIEYLPVTFSTNTPTSTFPTHHQPDESSNFYQQQQYNRPGLRQLLSNDHQNTANGGHHSAYLPPNIVTSQVQQQPSEGVHLDNNQVSYHSLEIASTYELRNDNNDNQDNFVGHHDDNRPPDQQANHHHQQHFEYRDLETSRRHFQHQAHSHESFSSAVSTSSSSSSSTSNSSEVESLASQLTRDEKKALEANIPLSYYEIVNLSIDQFNEQISKHGFTEAQLTLMKDIRRRGKNKVAAQTCRKRKMEQIIVLQHEVNHLRTRRRSLCHERGQLVEQHSRLVHEYDKIYAIIKEQMQPQPGKQTVRCQQQ